MPPPANSNGDSIPPRLVSPLHRNVSEMWGDISGQPVRGLTYWKESTEQRLFVSAGTHLYALDPEKGRSRE